MGEKSVYRYYRLYRPPVPGSIPRGMTNIVAFDERRHVDEIGRDAWGYAEYDKPLTPQQVVQYELAVATPGANSSRTNAQSAGATNPRREPEVPRGAAATSQREKRQCVKCNGDYCEL